MTVNAPPRIFDPRRHGWLAAWLGLSMIAVAATESVGLMLLAPMLIALGEAGSGMGSASGFTHWLVTWGIPVTPGPMLAIFVGLAVLRAAVLQVRTALGHRFEVSVVDSLRERAWSALLRCDWRVLSEMRQSSNASLLISEVDRVGGAVNQAISALAIAVTLGGVGLAALALSPTIALGMGLGGLLTLLAYRRLRNNAGQVGQQLSDAFDEVHAAVGEGLGALRVIKSFGKEAEVGRDLMKHIAAMRAAQIRYLRQSGLGQAAVQIVGALALAICIWLAIVWQKADPVTVLPFAAMFARALPLLGTLQLTWQNWSYDRPAMLRTISLIAEAEAGREDEAEAVAPPTLAKRLELEDVTVRFAGREEPALVSVSLTIPAGSIVLITGPSGAGKSTIADLAGGLISPDEGVVAIDGTRLEGGLRRAWRGRVAYVQQDPVLFEGSIRDNLLWADPTAANADLLRVLGEASADFVFALPDGLDTPVGEGGQRLSGGERQRIVLARALLRNPSLLILDEATSALDAGNEAAIAEAILALRGRLTVLVIGHRGALQNIADRTFRLRGGRLVADSASDADSV